MFVRNHMLPRKNLTVVSLEESLGSALSKMDSGHFLSLPVIENDEFKGYIMKEAIYRKYFEISCTDKEKFLENEKVSSVYTDDYKVVHEGDNIDDASYYLMELRTPFLAVLNSHDKFEGIVTHKAIFNAFNEVFGISEGTRIVVNMHDIPGMLSKLTDIIRKENINILNLAVVDPKVLDIIRVVLRVDTKDVDNLINKFEAAGFKIGDVTKS